MKDNHLSLLCSWTPVGKSIVVHTKHSIGMIIIVWPEAAAASPRNSITCEYFGFVCTVCCCCWFYCFDRCAVAAAVLVQLRSSRKCFEKFFHTSVCVGRVCHTVLETRETREKTPTRKFGSGSGWFSLNKISGFSGQTSENPKNSGRVGFRIFPGFWTL